MASPEPSISACCAIGRRGAVSPAVCITDCSFAATCASRGCAGARGWAVDSTAICPSDGADSAAAVATPPTAAACRGRSWPAICCFNGADTAGATPPTAAACRG
eukprot:6324142-Prymnesium_polylepis.1